jgi:hypothetical protein
MGGSIAQDWVTLVDKLFYGFLLQYLEKVSKKSFVSGHTSLKHPNGSMRIVCDLRFPIIRKCMWKTADFLFLIRD